MNKHVNRKRANRRPTRHIHAKQIERIERTPTQRAAGIAALLIVVGVLLLTSCGGAIAEKRAKLATAQPTTNTATATPHPERIQIAPPQPTEIGQPASVATGIEGGPLLDTFATVGVWLLFVAMCGGVVFLFASTTGRMFTKRMDTQRTAELFTHGGNDQ